MENGMENQKRGREVMENAALLMTSKEMGGIFPGNQLVIGWIPDDVPVQEPTVQQEALAPKTPNLTLTLRNSPPNGLIPAGTMSNRRALGREAVMLSYLQSCLLFSPGKPKKTGNLLGMLRICSRYYLCQ